MKKYPSGELKRDAGLIEAVINLPV
jgi:hypothetical protein